MIIRERKHRQDLHFPNPMRPIHALLPQRADQTLVGAPQLSAQALRQGDVLGIIHFARLQTLEPFKRGQD